MLTHIGGSGGAAGGGADAVLGRIADSDGASRTPTASRNLPVCRSPNASTRSEPTSRSAAFFVNRLDVDEVEDPRDRSPFVDPTTMMVTDRRTEGEQAMWNDHGHTHVPPVGLIPADAEWIGEAPPPRTDRVRVGPHRVRQHHRQPAARPWTGKRLPARAHRSASLCCRAPTHNPGKASDAPLAEHGFAALTGMEDELVESASIRLTRRHVRACAAATACKITSTARSPAGSLGASIIVPFT